MGPRSGFNVWDVVRIEFPNTVRPLARKWPALVIAVPELEKPFAILWFVMAVVPFA